MATRALRAPRLHLFTRSLSTTRSLSRQRDFASPAPHRLPKEEQDLFEKLQKQSTGAFSTPSAPPPSAATPQTPSATSQSTTPFVAPSRPQINQSPHSQQQSEPQLNATVNAEGKGEELHPDIRRGARPEFEGDVNPKTGEVGGPKNEPIRWGSTETSGDWSYNGRVTDF